MIHPFYRIPIYLFAVLAILLLAFSGQVRAQTPGSPKKEEIRELKKAIQALTENAASAKNIISFSP